LGTMSMTPIYGVPDPDEAIATLHRAPELGIDFVDTSDAYGANGANEELVGRALKGRRDKYLLSTKIGNVHLPDDKPGAKGNPAYVMEAWDKSPKGLAPTTSTSTTSIASTTLCRSRTRSAPWRSSRARARSAASAFPRPAPPPSAARTRRIR